ncbi:AsnC family protein [Desulfovibrio sp. An276]|uniref:siroheme decarboxylase subunit beta n=1 Tax=Desulfovibrio sp. An276 TaxID=1965618 RepID=UPI000B39CF8C|nr:siroheme decarboxylase subunit beta [Desulfovibrio sp. An276]OUO50481.1 AsnC family protein [Desulfovibrio sp. An276]
MAREFTPTQKDILRIVQEDLPDSLTPYADIAREVGTSEEAVLELLRSLKEEGVIRRFGASIKHQRTGWNVNAMVAWSVERERVEEVGTKASEHDHVSHCYYRPSSAEDWPYELYTMVHARSNEECTKVIEELRAMTGLGDYLVLTSIRELKKCSPTYF